MIVINGTVSESIKQTLMNGGTHPVSKRYGNLIVAGGNLGDGNIWSPSVSPIVSGSVSSSTGANSSSSSRLRTEGYIKVEVGTTYRFDSNMFKIFVIEYGEDQKNIGKSSGWKNTPFEYTVSEGCAYIRMTLANEGDPKVSEEDFEWLKIVKVKE